MVDVIGWIGSIFLAACGAPQAWKCYQDGHAKGLSPFFVCFWLVGEVCYVITILLKFGWVSWMMFNYGMNLVFICVILFYLVWPRKTLDPSPEVYYDSG